MAFYRETEEDITREYKITDILHTQDTGKSRLEIVRTNLFGDALFLDNELQMTSRDEYIYHESLVHPIMSFTTEPNHICILGGGDGCAAREVLKWSGVERIEIVDWDEELLALFKHKFCHWNSMSLQSHKVQCFAQDVLAFTPEDKYDVVIVDLLDPNYKDNTSRVLWPYVIGKLPSLLKPNGSAVINVGGIQPWDSENAEWINMLVANTFKPSTTHKLQAYKTFVPSFAADWCFLLISPVESLVNPSGLDTARVLKYFDKHAWSVATTWTRNYATNLPIEPVKLISYLPPV
jgi:spermidine synthase